VLSANTALLLALTMCLAVYVLYLAAARPSADDFGRASTSSVAEVIARSEQSYRNWCGRWASIGIQLFGWYLIPQRTAHLSTCYSLFLLAVHIVGLSAVASGIRILTTFKWKEIAIVSLTATAVYFACYHDPGQTIYWIPGATEGGLASVFLGLGITLIVADTERVNLLRGFCAGVLLFVASGCHELAGLVGTSFLCFFLVGYFLIVKSRQVDRHVLVAIGISLLLSGLGTAVSVFAPGNELRAAKDVTTDLSLGDQVNSFVQLNLRTARVLLSPVMLFGFSIAVSVFAVPAKLRPSFVKDRRLLQLVIVSAILSLVATAGVYGIKVGNNPAGRTVNFFSTSALLMVLPAFLGMFYNQAVCGCFAGSKHWCSKSLLLFCFAATVITGPTLDRGVFSYKKSLFSWLRTQEERHQILLEAGRNGEGDVLLSSSLPPAPPLLYTEMEVSDDPKQFGNQIRATYYGINSVRIFARPVQNGVDGQH